LFDIITFITLLFLLNEILSLIDKMGIEPPDTGHASDTMAGTAADRDPEKDMLCESSQMKD
jgi:hypothetical protein